MQNHIHNIQKILIIVALSLFGQQFAHAGSGDAWMTDFEAATAKAVAEGKPMLLDFTGSDWCPPCMMLEKQVFSKATFLDYAKDHLVLVELDFPRNKEQSDALKAQNEALAAEYRIEGFPTVIILSPELEVLDKTVGLRRGGAEAYVKHVKGVLAGHN